MIKSFQAIRHTYEKSFRAIVFSLPLLFACQENAFAYSTNDPQLPCADCFYSNPNGFHAQWNTPAGLLQLKDTIHSGFILESRQQIGADEIENFGSTVNTMVSLAGSPYIAMQLGGSVTTVVKGKAGQVTGSWDTEMLALNLSGNSLLGAIFIRESPTLASLGHTSVTDIGGNQYLNDSFFDLWLELSLDGGQTWLPQDNGPTTVVASAVPLPAAVWLFGGAIASLGVFGRKKLA